MADQDDELANAVRELTRTIDELRQELESSQRRSRFRSPAPRPPTPGELLRFTDEVAIPATVAVLETTVRALEGFQRALKLARTEREVRDRTTDAASATSERASTLRRTTLSRLDTVLAELQRAASDGTLPADERASDLLAEARELRDDVDSRLRDVGEDLETRASESQNPGSTDPVRIDIKEGSVDDSRGDTASRTDRDDPDPSVDVDAELETLKDQYGVDEGDDSSALEDADIDGAVDEPEAGSDDGETGVDAAEAENGRFPDAAGTNDTDATDDTSDATENTTDDPDAGNDDEFGPGGN